MSSIPGLGRSSGVGIDSPLWYHLENSMDRGAWWAIACGVSKSRTRLITHRHTHTHKRKPCRKESRCQGFVADSDGKRPVSTVRRDAQENQDDLPHRGIAGSPKSVSRCVQHKLPAGIMSGKSSWCG